MQDLSPAADTAIAARKAPPIDEGPMPTCGGCRLTITAIPTGRTIEVRSFESSGDNFNYTTATLCGENTPWVSAVVSSVPTSIDYGGDDFTSLKPFRFAVRQVSGGSGNSQISYTLSCFDSSTHGLITSSNSVAFVGQLSDSGGWGFKFPTRNKIGNFPFYDCPSAYDCEEEEEPEP